MDDLLRWWNTLSVEWKHMLIINYEVSKFPMDEQVNFFEDVDLGPEYFLIDLLKLDNLSFNEQIVYLKKYILQKELELDNKKIESIIQLKQLYIQQVESLMPLDFFPALKIVKIDNCRIYDINQLKRLEQLIFDFTTEDGYPCNEPSIISNPSFFSDKVNIARSINYKAHFKNSLLDLKNYTQTVIYSESQDDLFRAICLANFKILNKTGYKGFTDLLDLQCFGFDNLGDNYNPFKLYNYVFSEGFKYSKDHFIDYDSLNFLVANNCNLTTLTPFNSCKNLIALYILDLDIFPKYEIEKLVNNNVQIIHNGMSDWFFDAIGLFYYKIQDLVQNPEEYMPKTALNYLSKRKEFRKAYSTQIRHYKLYDHTLIVCNQFEKYFKNTIKKEYLPFIRFLLLIHDIGKARSKNETKLQYHYTIEFINKIILETNSTNTFDNLKLHSLKSFLSHDILGKYFQNKTNLSKTIEELVKKAKTANLMLFDFFKLAIIYYQCDTSAYTEDAGGFYFLEHLFEYRNKEKVFDKEEGLIRFSHKYWEMYLKLKKEIELCL